MANEQNLIPQNKRTKKEQREIAKKGGEASVKSRKNKKYLREILEEFMTMDLKDSKIKENMRKLGISETDMNIQNAITASLVQQALYGNLKAFTLIRDQLGQNPKDGQDKENIEGITFLFDIPKITTKAELEAELEKWNCDKDI